MTRYHAHRPSRVREWAECVVFVATLVLVYVLVTGAA